MIEVELKGLKNNGFGNENHYEDGKDSWIEWRLLDLVETESGRSITDSESFYVAACSPQYTSMQQLSDQEKKAFLTQEVYNEEELKSFARSKFDQLSFEGWDDFYGKMSAEFIYED
jgi:hypothetical protein